MPGPPQPALELHGRNLSAEKAVLTSLLLCVTFFRHIEARPHFIPHVPWLSFSHGRKEIRRQHAS